MAALGRERGHFSGDWIARVASAVSNRYLRIRAGGAGQCKAPSAGNTARIAQGGNAAVARPARSRRARPPWPVAALRPWAMGGAIPGGTRLATYHGERADAKVSV